MTPSRVLLYDGVCGFCNACVRTILRHDRRGTLRFAALQSEYGRAAIARHPVLQDVDSLVLLETSPDTGEEAVSVRSTAVFRLAAYLGGFWRLLLIARIVPEPARDVCYDLFARFRYRLFGKYDQCLIPSPDVRSRFLDPGTP